jgi:hypothetical protein
VSFDASPSPAKRRALLSDDYSFTVNTVEAEQNQSFHAPQAFLVKYSEESGLDQGIRLHIGFKAENLEDSRSDRIVSSR